MSNDMHDVAVVDQATFNNLKGLRHTPDPVLPEVEEFFFHVSIKDLPRNMPIGPETKGCNVRDPKPKSRMAKVLHQALDAKNARERFHLQNRGIHIFAKRVKKINDHTLVVSGLIGNGVGDGGNTYAALCSYEGDTDVFVKVRITVGLDEEQTIDAVEGENTSVEVKDASIMSARGEFNWIKNILGEELSKKVIWAESDDGDKKVAHLLRYLEVLNCKQYDNESAPTAAYSAGDQILDKAYTKYPEQFKAFSNIFLEILELVDIIAFDTPYVASFTAAKQPDNYPSFTDHLKRGEYRGFILDRKQRTKLNEGGVLIMLNSLRHMVIYDEAKKQFRWDGGFQQVKEHWVLTRKYLINHYAPNNNSNGLINHEFAKRPAIVAKTNQAWRNALTCSQKIKHGILKLTKEFR